VRLDAGDVMRRLRARQEEMIALFSRLRERAPLLETIRCHFSSIRFGELVLLPPEEQVAVHRFYDRLAELRWYFQYTTDMPGTVQVTLRLRLKELEEAHGLLDALLAEALEPPPVQAEVKKRALPRRKRR